uniref:Uncharacterized protein n=1 Tax=Pseudo-nitzschia australis TaxID=44445 RepID=A0A7S4EGK7_9STRA
MKAFFWNLTGAWILMSVAMTIRTRVLTTSSSSPFVLVANAFSSTPSRTIGVDCIAPSTSVRRITGCNKSRRSSFSSSSSLLSMAMVKRRFIPESNDEDNNQNESGRTRKRLGSSSRSTGLSSSSSSPLRMTRPTGATTGRRGTLFTLAGAALGLVVGTNSNNLNINGLASTATAAARKVSDAAMASGKLLYDRVLDFGKRHGAKAVASEELSEWIAGQKTLALEYPEIATWLAAQEKLREGMIAAESTVVASAELAEVATAATVAATAAAAVVKDGVYADEEENDALPLCTTATTSTTTTNNASSSADEKNCSTSSEIISSESLATKTTAPEILLPSPSTTKKIVGH